MVDEVPPDAGQVGAHRDVQRSQLGCRTDAAAQEQGRRSVRAGRQDDGAGLEPGTVDEAHADGPMPVKRDLRDRGIRPNGEVRTSGRGRQVGQGRADAQALGIGVHGRPAGTHRPRPIVILKHREPGRLEGSEPRRRDVGQRLGRVAADREWAVAAVPRFPAEVVIALESAEGRQDVLERPALGAERRPAVVVGRRAAEGEGGIGR